MLKIVSSVLIVMKMDTTKLWFFFTLFFFSISPLLVYHVRRNKFLDLVAFYKYFEYANLIFFNFLIKFNKIVAVWLVFCFFTWNSFFLYFFKISFTVVDNNNEATNLNEKKTVVENKFDDNFEFNFTDDKQIKEYVRKWPNSTLKRKLLELIRNSPEERKRRKEERALKGKKKRSIPRIPAELVKETEKFIIKEQIKASKPVLNEDEKWEQYKRKRYLRELKREELRKKMMEEESAETKKSEEDSKK